MYKVVHIGDHEVPMLAMASVDNYYVHIFGEDPVEVLEKAGDTNVYSHAVEMFKRMGFVMAKYAELKDRKALFRLTFDNYLDWLDQFDRKDLSDAIGEIREVYEGQKGTTVEPKKKDED